MKTIAFFIGLLLASFSAQAQKINASSFGAGGSNVSTNKARLSYTIGRLSMPSSTNSTKAYLTPGFFFTDKVMVSPIKKTKIVEIDLEIYPNPTTEKINIFFKGSDSQESYNIDIYDLMGKKINQYVETSSTNISGGEKITVNLGNIPSGQYFIRVISQTEQTKAASFKIIKQ